MSRSLPCQCQGHCLSSQQLPSSLKNAHVRDERTQNTTQERWQCDCDRTMKSALLIDAVTESTLHDPVCAASPAPVRGIPVRRIPAPPAPPSPTPRPLQLLLFLLGPPAAPAPADLLLRLAIAGRRRLASQNHDFANIRTATIRKYRTLQSLAARNSIPIIIIIIHICKNYCLQSPSLVRRR